MMTLKQALKRADLLAPNYQPGGLEITFVPGVKGHDCPPQLVRAQLKTAEACAVLAAEVRRLEERCRVLEVARDAVPAELESEANKPPLFTLRFVSAVDPVTRARVLEEARKVMGNHVELDADVEPADGEHEGEP